MTDAEKVAMLRAALQLVYPFIPYTEKGFVAGDKAAKALAATAPEKAWWDRDYDDLLEWGHGDKAKQVDAFFEAARPMAKALLAVVAWGGISCRKDDPFAQARAALQEAGVEVPQTTGPELDTDWSLWDRDYFNRMFLAAGISQAQSQFLAAAPLMAKALQSAIDSWDSDEGAHEAEMSARAALQAAGVELP